MKMPFASRPLAAMTVVIALGVGCGSAGGGGGCSGLQPLPGSPAPFGLPASQLIEGGLQARITKPGMDKLGASVTQLMRDALGSSQCVVKKNTIFNVNLCPASQNYLAICDTAACPGGAIGCPAFFAFNSADRPAPLNIDDGKNGVKLTVLPGTNPTIELDLSFDLRLPVTITEDNDLLCNDAPNTCTIDFYSKHYKSNSEDPPKIVVTVKLDTDPATGKLRINLQSLTIQNLGLDSQGFGSSFCQTIGNVFGDILGALNSDLGTFFLNFLTSLLKPQIESILQDFLPDPLGVAGVVPTAAMLASFSPPKEAGLEMFVVPGGYVQAKDQGLTLGVMTGVNSDRDPNTRTAGLLSEPSLCVPNRPAPDLAGSPWLLPYNAPRQDFTLQPAGPFAGSPDPVNAMGELQDVAIGISRTFLDLLGFHLYNSGSLCLAVGGSALPQLNAGTLSVVIDSLGNIIEDRKAPLALSLRPQQPLVFTVGAGTMADPLVHLQFTDLRVDFYAWMEERYVRLLTLALDLNLGLNLTVTKDANMQPALQPVLVGLDAANVAIRVSNTDLLQEPSAQLAQVFPALLSVATGALGGSVPPVTLPAVAGFSLDDITLNRVQTTEDDFIGIFAAIQNGASAPRIDWSDPTHPRMVGEVDTVVSVERLEIPPADRLRALFDPNPEVAATGIRPRVILRARAEGSSDRPIEFGWRVDGAMWRPWTAATDELLTLSDDSFLLQGRHRIEVRARAAGDWSSEDSTPAHLEVLIDSVPPELHPARDAEDSNQLAFGGFDLISEPGELEYAWVELDGTQTPFVHADHMSVSEAARITEEGLRPLRLYARDEAGNIGELVVDLGPLLGFHGRTTAAQTSGCACDLGGGGTSSGGTLGALLLGALLILRRRRARGRGWIGVILLGGLALQSAGCGCEEAVGQCRLDDECSQMQCSRGQVPQCLENMCVCAPDVGLGDVGRFASMTLIGPEAYVAAYNNTYGDLMIGHVSPPGVVADWEFVDGVPDDPPDLVGGHVRGGVTNKGDDVGRYTSIATTLRGDPVVAYYDKTHGTLKFASFGAIRWRQHVVDQTAGAPDGDGDDVGRWASLTIGPDGRPGIAYTAIARYGTQSGGAEGQLRWAQALVEDPEDASDWKITILDAQPLPATGGSGGAVPEEPLLPESVALMAAAARKPDGSPAIAFYDRVRGNLRYVEQVAAGQWSTPVILDGEDELGGDTGDVGLYPGLSFDEKGIGHISYVDATRDNLLYVDTMNLTPEVADDGYRPKDEQTLDGLDSPVFHLVGDSSSIQLSAGLVVVAYQDSTALQLRVAKRAQDGTWSTEPIAGHNMPFRGSYGFYANLRVVGQQGLVSSYAINQQLPTPAFFVEVFAIDLGLIL